MFFQADKLHNIFLKMNLMALFGRCTMQQKLIRKKKKKRFRLYGS